MADCRSSYPLSPLRMSHCAWAGRRGFRHMLSTQSTILERANSIQEDQSRLAIIKADSDNGVSSIVEALQKDQVVLVQNLGPDAADHLMHSVADQLGIADSLKLQAAFASVLGHRENIGRYYMSVNKRSEYQF